eukprot:939727-Rhodomonas_salina.7
MILQLTTPSSMIMSSKIVMVMMPTIEAMFVLMIGGSNVTRVYCGCCGSLGTVKCPRRALSRKRQAFPALRKRVVRNPLRLKLVTFFLL